jgi:hypothetical protein
MAAINELSDREKAARRFPRSRNYIHGNGSYGLCVRCPENWTCRKPWLILLFKTLEARDKARVSFRCSSSCFGPGSHEPFDLWTPPVKYKPASEDGMFDFGNVETR